MYKYEMHYSAIGVRVRDMRGDARGLKLEEERILVIVINHMLE